MLAKENITFLGGSGSYKIQGAACPEHETVAAFGSISLNSNIGSIAYLNDFCNRMGVDTISTGCM